MELETAARRFLLSEPAVNGYVAGKVFKHTLVQTPSGTGGCALVVRRSSGWASPDLVKTSEYPRLLVECWADPDRYDSGDRAVDNAVDKAFALFRVVDASMHGLRDVWWGAGGSDSGLRIVSCVRSGEPDAVWGQRVLSVGPDSRPADVAEMAMVLAVYNLHLVH